jgi:hypothetical protein
MARPKVPHCVECDNCLCRPAMGGGWLRFCAGVTSGPPAPILDVARRHTSPDWCPHRYASVISLQYDKVPAAVLDMEGER